MSFFPKGFWEETNEDMEETDLVQCVECGHVFPCTSNSAPDKCPQCGAVLDAEC